MNAVQKVLAALSSVAPNVFEAEVAAGLGYAVVLFNLHIDDTHKAAFLGAAVLVFTLAQAIMKATQSAPAASADSSATKGV